MAEFGGKTSFAQRKSNHQKEDRVKQLPLIVKVVLAGLVSSLITSVLFLALDFFGVFQSLGIPIGVPVDKSILEWFAMRLVIPGFCSLLFLLPVAPTVSNLLRGLVIGAVPAAHLLFIGIPINEKGILAMDLGISVILIAVFFSLLWGALAGLILDRFVRSSDS